MYIYICFTNFKFISIYWFFSRVLAHQSGPVHVSKRNPPPPPPPRSGSWLASNVYTSDSAARDSVNVTAPFEMSCNHVTPVTNMMHCHQSSRFVMQQTQAQQMPPSAIHGSRVTPDTQWNSGTYPVYANGHRAVPRTENVQSISAQYCEYFLTGFRSARWPILSIQCFPHVCCTCMHVCIWLMFSSSRIHEPGILPRVPYSNTEIITNPSSPLTYEHELHVRPLVGNN